MECGDEIPTMIEIKQEVDEEPESSVTGGYQVFFIKQEVEEEDFRQGGVEEDSRQDGVEEDSRQDGVEEDSAQDDEVDMQITTGSSSESVGNVPFENRDSDLGWQLSGEDGEQDEREEQSEMEVGNPSFQDSDQDSGWQLSGEDEKDEMRAGKPINHNNKQSSSKKQKLSKDDEGKDQRKSTKQEIQVGNAPCQISKEGMSSNQGISGRVKEKNNKRRAESGTKVGNPVLHIRKEGMRSNQGISRRVKEKDIQTITKEKDSKTSTKEKDGKTSTKPGTQGKSLRVDNSTVLVLSSGLKFNAELWTRADPSQSECSCHMVNSTSSHIPNQGVDSQKEQLNKEEGKLNSVSSHSKFGEMRRDPPHSNMPVLQQSSQYRPNCSKPCSTKSDLPVCMKTHITGNQHPSSDGASTQTLEKPHQCCDCGKRFSYKRERIEHMMAAHSGVTAYQCPHCYKGFDGEASLVQHIKDHAGDRPFQCSDCDKRFAKKYNLKLHMKTHTGDMPYHCSHCSKRFYRKEGLLEHVRIHTGERPFKCSYCSKSFVRKRNLSTHMVTHTGQSPYKCFICNKGFSSRCNHSKDIILVYPSE